MNDYYCLHFDFSINLLKRVTNCIGTKQAYWIPCGFYSFEWILCNLLDGDMVGAAESTVA